MPYQARWERSSQCSCSNRLRTTAMRPIYAIATLQPAVLPSAICLTGQMVPKMPTGLKSKPNATPKLTRVIIRLPMTISQGKTHNITIGKIIKATQWVKQCCHCKTGEGVIWSGRESGQPRQKYLPRPQCKPALMLIITTTMHRLIDKCDVVPYPSYCISPKPNKQERLIR